MIAIPARMKTVLEDANHMIHKLPDDRSPVSEASISNKFQLSEDK